ncbi:MAG TPA: flagellar filament capping protein FliD, partial [Anaerolineaceae bacterium]|nr:flagellar filament capping protein FliD [Anaerolineaceae bacterium]
LDKVMTTIDNKLARFSGEKSYVDQAIKTIDDQTELYNDQIESWNDRLGKRQEALYAQYAELQSQIVMMTYTQQQMSLIYSMMNS